jgi:hypothetical protein
VDKFDRIYFSNFAVDPEFESFHDYDELYDLEFDELPGRFRDEMPVEDTDEFIWDDI